jgi:predicted nucleic acid-binding protein
LTFVIDTSAWIEYFRGTMEGKKALPIIESNVDNVTPTIVLAEIKKKFVEWKRQDFESVLTFIEQHSDVIELDKFTAIMAGEIRASTTVKGIGLVDCILLAISRTRGCKVLTNDSDLSTFAESAYLKRDQVC